MLQNSTVGYGNVISCSPIVYLKKLQYLDNYFKSESDSTPLFENGKLWNTLIENLEYTFETGTYCEEKQTKSMLESSLINKKSQKFKDASQRIDEFSKFEYDWNGHEASVVYY